jgi:phage gpG-like protein
MRVSGDFAKLAKLRQRIADVTAAGFRRELGVELGAATVKLVADGFIGERDPYGVPWEDLKYRDGKILRKSGAMAASVNAQPTTEGFRLSIPKAYAPVHQYGARIAPHSRIKRQLLRRSATGAFARRGAKSYELQLAARATFANGITIPARPMLPERARGLPPRWIEVYSRDAADLLKRKLRSAA